MIIKDCKQRGLEWFEARRGIPTASQFSRIITPKTGKLSASADEYIGQLICEVIGGQVADEDATDFSSAWMDRGSYLEDEARDWYQFRYDRMVDEVGLILNDDQTAAVSPDGMLRKLEHDDFGLLEIKCPKPSKHIKHFLNGVLPDEYKPQCHAALAISDAQWIDLISYCPDLKPLVVRVTPDEYTDKVRSALDEFLVRYEDAKSRILDDE
jgi:hypothetical protein